MLARSEDLTLPPAGAWKAASVCRHKNLQNQEKEKEKKRKQEKKKKEREKKKN
jgi:ribosomal protein L12E/L44/L45/RPP1/RPP2